MAMTKKEEFNLKYFLLEGVVGQVKHEYDTEEEFEEMFGPTDTVDDVLSILIDIKDSDDLTGVYCPACIDADPENYQHYLYMFDCKIGEIGEHPGDYAEYVVRGYDKDSDVYEEYYRGVEREKAAEIADQKISELNGGELFRTTSSGQAEPIDWVEMVKLDDTDKEYPMDLVVKSSYENKLETDNEEEKEL